MKLEKKYSRRQEMSIFYDLSACYYKTAPIALLHFDLLQFTTDGALERQRRKRDDGEYRTLTPYTEEMKQSPKESRRIS